MDPNVIWATGLAIATDFGLKIVGALVVWFVGRWAIGLVVRLISKAMNRQHFDPTIVGYLKTSITVLLDIILIMAVLGIFGIQTTSFAALLAAGAVAVGVAWSGLLANFAAGVFLVLLKPFKVGDFVTVGGITGTISEIGLFGTTIQTPDNIWTLIGNNKALSDTIQNFSANAYRRVELVAQLDHTADHNAAIHMLRERLVKIPNVLKSPAPDVEILQFTAYGPLLAVRPYTNNATYWQVYFDTNRLIRDSFGEAGLPQPVQHVAMHSVKAFENASGAL